MASVTLLTTMLDFSDAGDIDVFVDEAERGGARGDASARAASCSGRDLAYGVLRAARERPRLVLRGQQLPQGQDAGRVRHPLLERRQHQPARADVLLVRAQHVPREQPARAGQADDVRRAGRPRRGRACRPTSSRRARTTSCRGRPPTSRRSCCSGEHAVRARRERPHRRRRSIRRRRTSAATGRTSDLPAGPDDWLASATEHAGQLVAGLGSLAASASRRRRSARRRRSLGNAKYKPIEAAPGRYVKVSASL